MPVLNVEVWSDVACPWCWVGKRHLELAAKDLGYNLRVAFRAFELDPSAPRTASPDDYVARLARKYGAPREHAQQMIDQMTARGDAIGLDFRFDRARAANTFDAHRLLHMAASTPFQGALKERLFVAYMNEGKLLTDHDTLVELAAEVGLDPDKAQAVLSSDAHAEDVRMEQAVAHKLGVTGVPFFVAAGRYAAAGAQPVPVLRKFLERAWTESPDLPPPEDGAVCGPEGCVLPVAAPAAE